MAGDERVAEVTQPTYRGYRRVRVALDIIDNGDGAGYLRLMWPDGGYVKVFPPELEGDDRGLFNALQATLNQGESEQEGGGDGG